MPSKRGGGSASAACKTGLRRCMVAGVEKGDKNLQGKRGKGFASVCMSRFNKCRVGRKRKSPKKRRR